MLELMEATLISLGAALGLEVWPTLVHDTPRKMHRCSRPPSSTRRRMRKSGTGRQRISTHCSDRDACLRRADWMRAPRRTTTAAELR